MRQDFGQDARRGAAADPRPRPPRRIDRNHVLQVALGVVVLLVLSRIPFSHLLRAGSPDAGAPFRSPTQRMVRPAYGLCRDQERGDCVADGATFWKDGVKYRIAGIETPEGYPGGCPHERDMAPIALSSLLDRLNEGGPVTIVALGPTPAGPLLPGNVGRPARVTLKDGRSLADVLVAGGAVRRSGAANPWCDTVRDPFAGAAVKRRTMSGGDDPPVRPLAPAP